MSWNIEISEDAFAALFKPCPNHLNPNASYDWGDGFGTMFETYGEELDHVRSQAREHIWTLLSGDEGDCVVNGFHFVNRLGYFVSEFPVPNDIEIQVILEDVTDETQGLQTTSTVIESIETIVHHLWEHDAAVRCSAIYQSLDIVRKWLKNREGKLAT